MDKFLKNIGLMGFWYVIFVVFDFQGYVFCFVFGFYFNYWWLAIVFQGIVKEVGQGIRQMIGISGQEVFGLDKRLLQVFFFGLNFWFKGGIGFMQLISDWKYLFF